MIRSILSITLIILLSMGLSGVIILNGTDSTYNSSGSGDKYNSNYPIKSLIIVGASHFLESSSNFQAFLREIELADISGPDYEKMKRILNASAVSIQVASSTYAELKSLSETIPYNQEIIDKLKSFDYESFKEGKKLNPQIFQIVKKYLSQGYVSELYGEMLSNTLEISEDLKNIKNAIDKNNYPDIWLVWGVYQKYTDSQLFGMYVSMIFKSI